jgi:hypothetical protein
MFNIFIISLVIIYAVAWILNISAAHKIYLSFFYTTANKNKWYTKLWFYGAFSPLAPIMTLSILTIILILICIEKFSQYFEKRKNEFGI